MRTLILTLALGISNSAFAIGQFAFCSGPNMNFSFLGNINSEGNLAGGVSLQLNGFDLNDVYPDIDFYRHCDGEMRMKLLLDSENGLRAELNVKGEKVEIYLGKELIGAGDCQTNLAPYVPE